ncbi:MAG: peptide chain release factor 2 [Deltaproteobacteria bacterium]|nr:peptide chain release factor 2 [Deltaproteobacteria bacterium]
MPENEDAPSLDPGELADRLRGLQTRFDEFRGVFDEAGLKQSLADLDEQAARPDLWDDRERAEQVLRKKRRVERELEMVESLAEALSDSEVLLELAREAEDADTLREAATRLDEGQGRLEDAELQRLLGGEHDAAAAIVQINAGAGGTDAADWAEMLLRMYSRWAEDRDMKIEILDAQPGDEAGLRSVTATISGDYAFGYLKVEEGVHRLVRMSPFDAQHRRHTAFASVAVFPELDDSIDVEVDEKDLRIDTYRAGGAGGQHVNKTDSAVRLTHEPTGIVVQCQNERSQHKNRAQAMKVLKARLYEHHRREQEEKLAAMRGEKQEIGFGSQIRSYTLHPAQRVKDHRTGVEAGNAQAVLDGQLDAFIRATLLLKSASPLEAEATS